MAALASKTHVGGSCDPKFSAYYVHSIVHTHRNHLKYSFIINLLLHTIKDLKSLGLARAGSIPAVRTKPRGGCHEMGAGVALIVLSVLATCGFAFQDVWLGPLRATGKCEMQIIAKDISVIDVTKYRRFCMRSAGYLWKGDCMDRANTFPNRLLPSWLPAADTY